MPTTPSPLEKLRLEIDRIDDAMHDLLMKRTAKVEKIRKLKNGAAGGFLRPTREAEVLRRLVARHKGPFPKPVLARLWREIMSALVRLQGPFSVAVFAPDDRPGYWDLARDQFGAFTPMTADTTVGQVMQAVATGEASVGVLPWPPEESVTPWWRQMDSGDANVPRIIARLPFAGRGNNRNGALEAVAIAGIEQEPSGRDRSVLLVDSTGETSQATLKSALRKAGMEPRILAATKGDGAGMASQYLVETDEFTAADDGRLAALVTGDTTPISRIRHLGGYAEPLDPSQLDVP